MAAIDNSRMDYNYSTPPSAPQKKRSAAEAATSTAARVIFESPKRPCVLPNIPLVVPDMRGFTERCESRYETPETPGKKEGKFKPQYAQLQTIYDNAKNADELPIYGEGSLLKKGTFVDVYTVDKDRTIVVKVVKPVELSEHLLAAFKESYKLIPNMKDAPKLAETRFDSNVIIQEKVKPLTDDQMGNYRKAIEFCYHNRAGQFHFDPKRNNFGVNSKGEFVWFDWIDISMEKYMTMEEINLMTLRQALKPWSHKEQRYFLENLANTDFGKEMLKTLS